MREMQPARVLYYALYYTLYYTINYMEACGVGDAT
jgi:hypothetical protein